MESNIAARGAHGVRGIGLSEQERSSVSTASRKQASSSLPTINLPKGGGAIRGIGEKFTANPVTGTGSITVPIATSPGRSDFGPQLSLSYDSGSGNGIFGFGWNLSLPSITRKTDKGLPKYLDAEESDEFILSGAEDLVPVLEQKDGAWQCEKVPLRTINGKKYRIQRYRPRIEGLFARIERWTNQSDPTDVFWRSISRDNITTWYGKAENSRIFDPVDPKYIFSWLISQSYDDKGNVIIYEYEKENSDGVDKSQSHEKNKTDKTRSANRYLKRIKYGNRTPYFPKFAEDQPQEPLPQEWFFEVVFDYLNEEKGEEKNGQHYKQLQPDVEERIFVEASTSELKKWDVRKDPFSGYRAGFEIRTYRLCHRLLMFHHFPDELSIGDYLVRSTEFTYDQSPIAPFITSVTQSGYKYHHDGKYLKKSMPPVEFEYSPAVIHEDISEIDRDSLENLPYGLDGTTYQWVDLDGEGVSGILTEQAGSWFYKRNLSPGHCVRQDGTQRPIACFGPAELLATKPTATLAAGQAQLMDLAGDGQLDLVQLDGSVRGFYERTDDADWKTFRPFSSWPNLDTRDPNLKFIDLTGDGHADILISEDHLFTWYQSLAESGFAYGERVQQALDDEKGPRLVFADGTQSIYLVDLSGDGLTDLARISNGEVCYWPNLGYGRFGAKVTMDNSPYFDMPDQFDQRRIRLADIDGSGIADIIYLKGEGVYIYLNESGNRWADPEKLQSFPHIDNLSSVMAVDLLGNGTTCLVWSSPLPGNIHRPMCYIDLTGGQKPHLLTKVVNNLGAETHVHYAPSTKFYLADKEAGKPWITKVPFPVHVVERVETYDRISRNRFVTRYAYHHGYFDGVEREFRGFGMVEQWDTEEYAVLTQSQDFPTSDNIEESSHLPPVLTRTWFHTGTYIGRNHISNFFAGLLDANDIGEYYREPGLTDAQARQLLLDDTMLPNNLTIEEEREACRALKGLMLRQEVYALDGTHKENHPYTVTEQNFAIRRLQPMGGNRHAVFFTHAHESISYHYERDPVDPRTAHALTLEVDDYGNVLKEAAIGYGRHLPDTNLSSEEQAKQTQSLVTYTENRVTNTIEADDDYRTPLPCEIRTFELTGYPPTGAAGRFQISDFTQPDPADPSGRKQIHTFDSEVDYEDTPPNGRQRRLIEHLRTLYRPDDLGVSLNDPLALLPLETLESLALSGESYKLAFTPGLLAQVYKRPREDQPPENLLPNPTDVLPTDLPGGQVADRGGYVDLDGDGHWWIPDGRVLYSPNSSDTAEQELTHARQHFFLAHRYRDPFGQTSSITNDAYDLLMVEARDAMGNRVTAGNDYRVLQPVLVTDPNQNRSAVAIDALGMVVGTAVMGKPLPAPVEGDSLAGFDADLTDSVILDHLANPLNDPHGILQRATTRLVYDLFAYHRTIEQPEPQPPVLYTIARETHDANLDHDAHEQTRIQQSFSYSDGFGREIQKKIQAEPGSVPKRNAEGKIIAGPDGQPEMTKNDVSPRWVGSGWTVFNNKGKPVRQYEPFFTDTQRFEFDVRIGVSPVLFYDPAERIIATLHPNHTWEKVVFEPWRQETWDVSDTVLAPDPKEDPDIGDYFRRLPNADYLPTWYAQRQSGSLGQQEQVSALKTAIHANTPTVVHFDSLGRAFLTVAHNKFKRSDIPAADPPTEEFYRTQVIFDIEGNQRKVIDAEDRIVMRYYYDMLGNRIHQVSMEAGKRWMLNDVTGKPIRSWDSRNHQFRTIYDELRRPTESYMSEDAEPVLVEQTIYGEILPNPEASNLRGQMVQLFDQAGVVISDAYDFKGNLLSSRRQLAQEYKTTLDWSAAVPLEAPIYTSRIRYDALNRPIQLTAPHSDQSGTKINVIQPHYNEANLLERVHVWLNQNAEPTDLLVPATANLNAVTDIDYDAKGQRTLIDYGNGVRTTYQYDPLTFHLTHMLTRRNATSFPGDCPQPPPSGWPGCHVQNLHYTYDPVGNITHIHDDAQQTIYFRNKCVEPSTEYTYDALNRLIEANGREHLGQIGGAPIPHSHNDTPRVGIDWSANDGNAMGTYFERYIYDAVGNFLEMQHRGSNPAHPGWTRNYAYNETSLIEDGTGGAPLRTSNRLSTTTVGNNNPPVERYVYDAHGNMTRMPHLAGAYPTPNVHWDYRDQQRQVDLSSGTAWYVYDVAGQRVRKVWEKSANLIEERIYLGSLEIFRRRNGAGAVMLQRETLHLMDDKQRIAMVETRTIDTAGNDPAPPQLIRYQFGNHLGSASLELDDQAQIISYEEYTPYGSTSYQAVRSHTELPKRYRYTGKERDEESGFYYHGARYYTPWLGRWMAADPKGIQGGINLYVFVLNNPIKFLDPNGRDVRLSVDQQTHTITYSTTVHIFASQTEIRRLRPLARDAERFFRNPTIETDTETWARWARPRNTPGPAARQPVFTDATGTQWNVRFDVHYRFHNITQTPPPFTYNTVGTSAQSAASFINNRATNEQTMQRSFGYTPGDNVMTLAPAGGNVGGDTLLLSTPDAARPTFGRPESRMFARVSRSTPFNRDQTRESLIHETGHLLGFDDRYFGGPLPNTHNQFTFDLMAASASRTEITMHPIHIEEAGRFGAEVSNGRTLVSQVIRGPVIDSTGTRGNIPLLDATGNPNPAYAPQQTLVRTELFRLYRGRVTGAVPPPVVSPPTIPNLRKGWLPHPPPP